jgi:DNA-binding MarR family transcriptional regulator
VHRDRRLFLDVSATTHYVVQILEHQLRSTGIPPYQLALVTHIREHQPVTPTAVSAASGVPLTTLRDNVQRLVERRLVRRVPHPTDGRSYVLELTARGEVMARAADPALAEAYATLERLLPKALEHYQATVTELNTALESALAALDSSAPRTSPSGSKRRTGRGRG